jgi:hypothetical protein
MPASLRHQWPVCKKKRFNYYSHAALQPRIVTIASLKTCPLDTPLPTPALAHTTHSARELALPLSIDTVVVSPA